MKSRQTSSVFLVIVAKRLGFGRSRIKGQVELTVKSVLSENLELTQADAATQIPVEDLFATLNTE